MRSTIVRLAAIAAGVLLVANCDTRQLAGPRGGTLGSSTATVATKPAIVIDSPSVRLSVRTGDSVLVSVRLHDAVSLKSASIRGVTERGSAALGTFTQTPRYSSFAIPVTGTFRAGLKDTTIRRYLKPTSPSDTTTDSLIVIVVATDSLNGTDSARVRVDLFNPPPRVTHPSVVFVTPTPGQPAPIGESLFVRIHLTAVSALRSATLSGVTEKGSALLGSFTQTPRYRAISIPGAGTFRPGLGDTTIDRYLFPINPADTSSDSLVVLAKVVDTAGLTDSARVRVALFKPASNVSRPTITIDLPARGSQVNLGDPIEVRVHLQDRIPLTGATITGVSVSGSVDLGTFQTTPRYKPIVIPVTGNFRPGLPDTTFTRFLQPINPADTTVDSLIVIVTAQDSAGKADTAQRRVDIVAGPKVTVLTPAQGDLIPGGIGMSVAVRATHAQGVARISVRVQGDKNWPTVLDTTLTQVYITDQPKDVTFSSTVVIPANAPVGSTITVSATALDVNRQPGSSKVVTAVVRAVTVTQPRVTQTVPARLEYTDSIAVQATGDGIAKVGLIIKDADGNVVQTDTVALTPPFNSNLPAVKVALKLPPTLQGKNVGITAFAIDQAGHVGYAVSSNNPSSTGDPLAGLVQTTLVVYGRTYVLPRQGIVGDIVVDSARGNVFLSNTVFNLLEVWQQTAATRGFTPSGIPVGSLPWGMFMGTTSPLKNDTLLVANSGGTNISQVFVGSTSVPAMREDLSRRILTRNNFIFTLNQVKDPNTGKITIVSDGPFSYSDRPQYVAQSAGGRIYFSTRPTPTAPAGTVRWIDPALPVPDPQQIWQYGTFLKGSDNIYAVFNIDSLGIRTAGSGSPASDTLTIFDHKYGSKNKSDTLSVTCPDTLSLVQPHCTEPLQAITIARARGSDAFAILRLDVTTLGLTDTTYVAASGDNQWLAFGEGNKAGAGRVVMVNDTIHPCDHSRTNDPLNLGTIQSSGAPCPDFISPLVTITDLTDNASEQVFGLAIDKHGATVASHGLQTYFAAVTDPFHLRLQGKFDSADRGAGIAFHPEVDWAPQNGVLTAPEKRIAFVGSASGFVEIVDVGYYISRGTLQLKNSIYGALRATGRLPGDPVARFANDPQEVVLHLFTMSEQGLVVIDLTRGDIKAGPP
jgi:hypothetical protein